MRRRRFALLAGLFLTTAAHQAPPAFSQAAAVPPAQTPATPQTTPPAQPPGAARGTALAFASDAGIVLSPVLPAQAAVFEDIMRAVRAALEKSADPVRKQQAAGWKIYKGVDPYQGLTLYVSVMDPAVKGADYNVFTLLKEAVGDVEARILFEEFRDTFGGPQNVVDMTPLLSMAPVK
jgi:hypothetical protein